MFTCKFCNKEFQKKQALAGHETSCRLNPNFKTTMQKSAKARTKRQLRNIICPKCGTTHIEYVTDYKFSIGKYKHYCSRTCANSHNISNEQKNKVRNSLRKIYPGKTYICKICDKQYHWKDYHSKNFCSQSCYKTYRQNLKIFNPQLCEKMSRIAKEKHYGGVNEFNYQKFKHGWYHGIFCGSSWQLAFVIYMLDIGNDVKRCQKVLEYEYMGSKFKYYPDFEINGIIYEIKGYEDAKSKVKHELFPEIEYYNKEKMKPILKYVKEKYGKNFISLFQKSPK